MTARLTQSQLKERLDDILGAVLSSRRTTAKHAQALSALERAKQSFILHWAGVVANSNSEMAFQFVESAARAFELMDVEGVEAWVIAAMDTYDRHGLYPGTMRFRNVDRFAEQLAQNRYSVSFESRAGILEKYLKGVSGRNLDLAADEQPWTDTEILFLPESVGDFDSIDSNFQLLKSMTAYLWAQTRFGTFRVNSETGVPVLCSAIAEHANPDQVQRVFESVEEVRLLACVERELPGLARQMTRQRCRPGADRSTPDWDAIVAPLKDPAADVRDSLAAAAQLIRRKLPIPEPAPYRGTLNLERVRIAVANRVEAEKEQFQQGLALLMEDKGKADRVEPHGEEQAAAAVSIETSGDGFDSEAGPFELVVDGELVEPPADLIQTASSIVQDFGRIPEDYLVMPTGSDERASSNADHEDCVRNGPPQDGIFYDEWDYRRNHYRKDWCVLHEKEMHLGDAREVDEILNRYDHLIGGIRKTFEALRGDDRVQRKQKHGDDIDIEAVIEGYVDARAGMEMSENLFTRTRRVERDLAVVFMVDVSGSTRGWISDAERESLVLLCEALETLNDRYAIYGFSGMTRNRCELYRIKTFEEHYGERVKKRIAGIRPQDYTRMGVTIRHLSKLLLEVDAKTRVLITLSDGRPDDYDGYRGDYGIEDTRRALMEAKFAGIHPFCITIDTHAQEYLPHMYGQVNYTVVSDVRKLPLSVSGIYRRLTS